MNEATKAVIDVSGKDFRESIPGDGGTVETGPGTPNKEMRKLRDNPLDGFRNGACLDLRVRFAMELLSHGAIGGDGTNPKAIALAALNIATELFAEADARGLIEDFGPMDDYLKGHVKRATEFQLEGQKEQKRQMDQSVHVANAVRDAIHRPN